MIRALAQAIRKRYGKAQKAALAALNDANFVASQRACDAAWSSCESSVRSASKGAWLPSTSRYAARIATCNATLTTCIGPASAKFHNSHYRSWRRRALRSVAGYRRSIAS